MVTDHRIFRNVSARDPMHNSYHYIILGGTHSATLREQSQYFGRHMWIPLRPPFTLSIEYQLFAELCKAMPKLKAREASNN